MRFTSVNGLGGALELGFVQNGMQLVHRTGSLDLGAPVVRGNRPLLGWTWDDHFSPDWRDWKRPAVEVVAGNPPCSGFSTLTSKKHRGIDAKINRCIWELISYAGALKPAPLIVAFESVQQAFSGGGDMMRALRENLEAATGQQYHLTHLLQSNASLGGVSVRKRYFWVAHRVPFGVEYAQPARVARLGDAIRDLEGLTQTFAPQPYARPATWWSLTRRAARGVDGHASPSKQNAMYVDLMDAMTRAQVKWHPGENTTIALRKLYRAGGTVPEPWARKLDKHVGTDFDLGINQTMMWDPEKQGHVVTGMGPVHSVHYSERRLFTYREVARIQGFPDTWQIWPSRNYTHIGSVWGKGVPVDAARWLGKWIALALEDNPGTVRGEPIGFRETKVDFTNSFKHTLDAERLWEHQRYVLHEYVANEDYERESA